MWSSSKSPVAAIFLSLASLCLAQPDKTKFTCVSCHVEAKTQPDTDMAHAMEDPAVDPVFRIHPKLTYQLGTYRYTIEQRGGQETYSVTDGKDTITLPIRWAFGRNIQTYVLQYKGRFYEGLVTYFPVINGLDITIGDQSIQPKSIEEAMGRLLSQREVKACFGCHTTNAVVNQTLQLDRLTFGVTCEHCHAHTAQHREAISRGKLTAIPPKLQHMSAEDASTFCGQCHRTWQTVVENRWLGSMNVRFQSYRLANSKCFDGVDERISCLACHDPHREIVQDNKAYDTKCLACHSVGAKPSLGMISAHSDRPASVAVMKVCPVAKDNCVSCHMPEVPLPGAHRLFTDHDIRIVKPNEPYPN